MDNSSECSVCLNLFSSLRVPKSLQCGHTFCSDCVASLVLKKLCPMCAKPINPDTISVNYALLERISFYEIFCTKHPESIATHFSLSSITAYCLECAGNTSGLDLVEASFIEIGNSLLRRSFEFEYNSKMNEVTKAKLAKLSFASNNDKIKILRSVLQEFETVKCSAHLKTGIFFSFKTAEVLCSDCQMTGGEVPLESKQFDSLIDNEIRKNAFFIDSVKLTQDLKNSLLAVQKLNLVEKIRVYNHLIVKNSLGRAEIVPATCNHCGQEFSFPANLPVRLPCTGWHFVCEICKRMINQCPIDRSALAASDGVKVQVRIPLCHNCNEILDSSNLPLLQPCGTVTCGRCAIRSCQFCGLQHGNTSVISKYFIQLSDALLVRCVRDNKTAKFFSTSDNSPYCQSCKSSLPGLVLQNLLEYDLSFYLIAECRRQAERLGARMTPVILNNLNALNSSTNWQRLELLRLLNSLATGGNPLASKATAGFSVPAFLGRAKYMQRFSSILPNPTHNSGTSKPWFIKRNENQVEVLTFSASRTICLVGVTVTCPVQGVSGALEYLEVFSKDKRVASCIRQQFLCGVVQDVFFQQTVKLEANTRYDLIFKIDADLVYKGNPLDRTNCEGTDGTIFEVYECKMKGILTNGQSHLSGPLIRIIYNEG